MAGAKSFTCGISQNDQAPSAILVLQAVDGLELSSKQKCKGPGHVEMILVSACVLVDVDGRVLRMNSEAMFSDMFTLLIYMCIRNIFSSIK